MPRHDLSLLFGLSKPFIVSINSVSGGGKTALATALHSSLPQAALFCFDHYDASNIYPDDFYAWYQRGADNTEFDCPGMAAAVDAEIRRGQARYIVLDFPLGRNHPRFGDKVDLAVFVDTPLDVAMARRILRDYPPDGSPQDQLAHLRNDLGHYLTQARYPYLDTYKDRECCDLVLDGWCNLDKLRDDVLDAIKNKG
jgi:uridine kinase